MGSIIPLPFQVFVSFQGRARTPLQSNQLQATNGAVTVRGSALRAGKKKPIEQFAVESPERIEQTFRAFLQAESISPDTDELIILDLEPTESDPSNGSYAPNSFGEWLATSKFQSIVDGYKKRIEVARSVLPHAKLSLYQVAAPDARGQRTERFEKRMEGYHQAAQLGMFDALDCISPNLYTRFGDSDRRDARGITMDTVHEWIQASTRQGVEASLSLSQTLKNPLELAPFLTFKVFNGSSRHHRKAVLPETLRHQLETIATYQKIYAVVLWAGNEEAETSRQTESDERETDIAQFLDQIARS